MKKNKITQINCHAEFSSASHGILKQVQDDRNNESGRSMVEMLGVLAIIGVLSVGGIAGYTTAMNSHRANEAIQNATRLAVLLSSKRLLNSSTTLSEDELAGTGFEIAEDTDKIVLSVSVSDAVKSKIEGMGLKTATLGTNDNKLTFTFNNDLSERSGSQNQDDPCAGVDCNTGTCSGGVCNCSGTGYTGDYCDTPLIQGRNITIYRFIDSGGSVTAYYSFDNGTNWVEIKGTGNIGVSSQIKFKMNRTARDLGNSDEICYTTEDFSLAPNCDNSFFHPSGKGEHISDNWVFDQSDWNTPIGFSIYLDADD